MYYIINYYILKMPLAQCTTTSVSRALSSSDLNKLNKKKHQPIKIYSLYSIKLIKWYYKMTSVWSKSIHVSRYID